MAPSREFLQRMPKVELHVHIEGSIRPETVLKLARKNDVALPADTVEGLAEWYRFRDFPHFVEVYVGVTRCVQTAEDIETVLWEFMQGQAEQNVLYTEATYTASTVETHCGIPWPEQRAVIESVLPVAERQLGTRLRLILDIVRGETPEQAMTTLDRVTDAMGSGVCGLGIAGFESRGTLAYREVFAEAARRGLPVAAHAGETEGAWSVAETLDVTGAPRIGHGVRSLEDPAVVERLVSEGVVLEVCPTSNVCLGVVPDLASHPIQRLIEAGVAVTVNSDDPPMFGTSLTEEWVRCSETFAWDEATARRLTETAAQAAFLPAAERESLVQRLRTGFDSLAASRAAAL
jgi:adenosine deaminase